MINPSVLRSSIMEGLPMLSSRIEPTTIHTTEMGMLPYRIDFKSPDLDAHTISLHFEANGDWTVCHSGKKCKTDVGTELVGTLTDTILEWCNEITYYRNVRCSKHSSTPIYEVEAILDVCPICKLNSKLLKQIEWYDEQPETSKFWFEKDAKVFELVKLFQQSFEKVEPSLPLCEQTKQGILIILSLSNKDNCILEEARQLSKTIKLHMEFLHKHFTG